MIKVMVDINNIKTPRNLDLAFTRLLTNPESTYKNYYRSVYATYDLARKRNIKNLSNKIKSGYLPEKSYKVYMPKPNGLSRMYTLISIEDQIVYQSFANKLADQMQMVERIKNRYKKSVFGNLYAGKDSQYFYQSWESSYCSFTKAIIKSFQFGNKYIATFDLTSCYDSINHNLIKNILMRFHFSDACANSLIRLLERWCSPQSYILGVGIPQGPQASGIIAEAVLAEYDSYIEELQRKYSFSYFRYVDDIKVLAKDKETVEWVLCLLDKKSKELGLFPQSSKISVHQITNIAEEVKQISKPLFDDDIEEFMKPFEASHQLKLLLKSKSSDVTSVKRYLQYIDPNSKNNKLVLRLLSAYPTVNPSFVYYVQRYPRLLPPLIVSYIRELCLDKTKQYYAGILLKASVYNLSCPDIRIMGELACTLLKKDKKESFINDPLFKEQLLLLLILSEKYTVKSYLYRIRKENNWWIRQQLLSDLLVCDTPDVIINYYLKSSIVKTNPDESLVAAMGVIVDPSRVSIPPRNQISPIAQEALKAAGIISRSKYTSSQINRYLEIITEEKWSFPWKKNLGERHSAIERAIFAASCYWKTDLTSFVNLWDTIDDQILFSLTSTHSELGGYALGKVGSIKNSTNLSSRLPQFHLLVNRIHEMRLSSYLSHAIIARTGKSTGPIPFKERKCVLRLIVNGMRELESYWK